MKSGNPVRPTSQRGIPAVTVNPNGDRMGRKKVSWKTTARPVRDRKKGHDSAGEAGGIARFLHIKSEVLAARLMALFVESITIRKSLRKWRLPFVGILAFAKIPVSGDR